MFSLNPLGDLSHLRRKKFCNEACFTVQNPNAYGTIDIISSGLVLAARSAVIGKVLERTEHVPVDDFTEDMAGLETCLDLIYGGSVNIGEDNFKAIYKFGKIYQITEMVEGVLTWIVKELTHDKFWDVYFELENLKGRSSFFPDAFKELKDTKLAFVDAVKRHLGNNEESFLRCTIDLFLDQHERTVTSIVDLISTIYDKRILPVIVYLVDDAMANNGVHPSGYINDNNSYLQTVASITVTYIEDYIKSSACDHFDNVYCTQTLKKISVVCTDVETLQIISSLLADLNLKNTYEITELCAKDLTKEKINQLTSLTTPYATILSFTKQAGKEIHPCVVVEIVLKWWSNQKDREQLDMGFIKPLIIDIQNASTSWYYSVSHDVRYKSLINTLSIRCLLAKRFMLYNGKSDKNKRILYDCIRKGDGTPAHLARLQCTASMKKYGNRLFKYDVDAVPSYVDTKHHWYISIKDKHVSLITDSHQELLTDIREAEDFRLYFVPLPHTSAVF